MRFERLVRSTCTYICKYNHYANGGRVLYKYYMRFGLVFFFLIFAKDTGTHMRERDRLTHREIETDSACSQWVGKNRLVFMSFVKFYLIFESFMKSLIFVFHAKRFA